ncbi:hypothetical protein EVA_05573 [gut metagenome]|uniref:Uncharacterized protein n=1 Tax=gut metagenome TaxID=749906 RepID=J9GH25_9ZZZZ
MYRTMNAYLSLTVAEFDDTILGNAIFTKLCRRDHKLTDGIVHSLLTGSMQHIILVNRPSRSQSSFLYTQKTGNLN